jgi:Ser-tRNA(Ala) deacylase AlaX
VTKAFVSDHMFAAYKWRYKVMCLETGTHIAYAMVQQKVLEKMGERVLRSTGIGMYGAR